MKVQQLDRQMILWAECRAKERKANTHSWKEREGEQETHSVTDTGKRERTRQDSRQIRTGGERGREIER